MFDLRFFSSLTACLWATEVRRLAIAFGLSALCHLLLVIVAPSKYVVTAGDGQMISAQLVTHDEVAVSVERGRVDRAVQMKKKPRRVAADGHQIKTVSGLEPIDESLSGQGGEGASLGVRVAEEDYFSSELLTVRPYPLTILDEMLGDVNPAEMFGKAVLKIWINATGEIAGIETEFADMSEAFHSGLLAAFERMRFMPGQVDGKPVGSILKIEIGAEDFRLPVQ
ncbi:energy transducer TonB [Dechloromonas denitrificans]|uniref:energy transducer TonB n=1 Tax=Dechloromonas denitrificans TaxID=281362 RepID=UPI0012FBA94F|nr:hypothetical protein [Dechloromonas denitrificans]